MIHIVKKEAEEGNGSVIIRVVVVLLGVFEDGENGEGFEVGKGAAVQKSAVVEAGEVG